MKRALQFVMALATLLAGVCAAVAQTQTAPGAALKNGLKEQYQVSKKSARSMADVKTVLVVQKEGIVAFPPEKAVLSHMTYKDGELQAPSSLATGSSGEKAPRMLQVGAKVYVTGMDVNVAGDKVTFTVQECDPCHGASVVSASTAELVFEFPQGYLALAEAAQVADVVGEVLAFEGAEPVKAEATAASSAPAAPTAGGAEVLTNRSVIEMVSARLPDEVVITKIETSATNFDVTTAGLVELNNNHVPVAIVKAMLRASKNNAGVSAAAGSNQAAPNEEGPPALKHNSVDTTEPAAAPEPDQENLPLASFSVFHSHNAFDPNNWTYCKGTLYIFPDRVRYVVASTQGGRTDDFEVTYDGISEIKKNAWPIMHQLAFHIKLKTGLSLNFLPEGADVASVLAAFPSPPRK